MSIHLLNSKALATIGIFLLLMTGLTSKAQSSSELIIQVPAVSEKNFDTLKQQLAGINGVTYSGFCDSEKFFLLTIDRNIQPDNSSVETIFKNLGLEFFLKDGTIAMARSNCKDWKPDQPVNNSHD